MKIWIKRVLAGLFLCVGISVLITSEKVYADTQNVAGFSYCMEKETLDGDTVTISVLLTGEAEKGTVRPSDVVLLLDCSGSMKSQERFTAMQNAVLQFIDMVDLGTHRIGIVTFENSVTSCALTNDSEKLKRFITELSCSDGGTATERGIAEAARMLSGSRAGATPAIVLMTDGESNDLEATAQAATEAKAAKNVFYTVALLSENENPDTSMANQELKKIATSGLTHHFVLGSQGLAPVYREISQQIGEANPRNVVVTHTISSKFELVEGSTDENIPRPVIKGNTLTWEMAELRGGETLQLTYQLKVPEGTGAGIYPNISSGTIAYTNYKGVRINSEFHATSIKVINRPPVIHSVSQTVFDVGGGESVTIQGENFSQNTQVTIGTTRILNTILSGTDTITFTMPAHAQGDYELSVTNKDGASASRIVTFKTNPLITAVYPEHGAYEGGTQVKISGKYFLADPVVTFNGVEAELVKAVGTYIYVKTPFLDTAGAVDICVTNTNGMKVTAAGAYSYDAKIVPPPPAVTGISLKEGVEGKVHANIKITGRGFVSGTNFKVMIGNYEIPETNITKVVGTYIYVDIPDTIPAGVYDITVVNADGTQAVMKNAYTCTPKPVPPTPVINSLSKTSGTQGIVQENVKISGRYFRGGGNFCVTIGTYRIPDADVVKVVGTYIYINVPDSIPVGTYDVTVTNDDGAQAVLPAAYTIHP